MRFWLVTKGRPLWSWLQRGEQRGMAPFAGVLCPTTVSSDVTGGFRPWARFAVRCVWLLAPRMRVVCNGLVCDGSCSCACSGRTTSTKDKPERLLQCGGKSWGATRLPATPASVRDKQTSPSVVATARESRDCQGQEEGEQARLLCAARNHVASSSLAQNLDGG